MDIGKQLKKARVTAELTQSQLCQLFEDQHGNLKQSVLSRYERGTTMPPADKFQKLMTLCKEYTACE